MKSVLIITYWSYREAHIQVSTLPYVRLIQENIQGKVFLVTLEKKKLPSEEAKIRRELKNDRIDWLPFRYAPFGILMTFRIARIIGKLWFLILKQRITFIHCWCTAAGAIGYFLSKLTGRKLIIDSYEPHAEPMIEAGQWQPNSRVFKILFNLEKRQSNRAYAVIACVDKMKAYAKIKYGVSLNRFYSKPAAVDFDLFHLDKKKDADLLDKYNLTNKVVYVYAGKFGGIYLFEDVFRIFKRAEDYYGNSFRVLLLNGQDHKMVDEQSKAVGLNTNHLIHEFVPHHEVPKYIGLGDVGLVPVVPVPSKRYASPIKTGEYFAMGLPVIITKNISDDSEMVENQNLGYVLQDLSDEEITKSIAKVEEIRSEDCTHRIRNFARETRKIHKAKYIYSEIYD